MLQCWLDGSVEHRAGAIESGLWGWLVRRLMEHRAAAGVQQVDIEG